MAGLSRLLYKDFTQGWCKQALSGRLYFSRNLNGEIFPNIRDNPCLTFNKTGESITVSLSIEINQSLLL